jgi:signal transduction histidine kinase
MAINKKPVDLRNDVVLPMLAQLQGQLDEADMHADNQVPEGLRATADPALLRIVADNLLGNAAKYGRQGGRIEIASVDLTSEVRLSVWNEGEGIAQENIPRLFGKFVRLDQPSARARKGSGLGLFVCREIIEQHGGRIWAESDYGRWARFTFSIPKEPSPAAP